MSHSAIRQLAELLGPGIALRQAPVGGAPLWPQEAETVARAVPKRQAEFAAGRAAARVALAALGHPEIAIPAGPHRAPLWPTGIVGSITHTNGCCFAALARQTAVLAIGVDAELAVPLSSSVASNVLTPHEQRLSQGPLTGTAIFSAKEAVYKALSDFADEIWDFDAMTIAVFPDQNRFEATLRRDAGPVLAGDVLTGVMVQNADHILTGYALRP